MNKFLLRRLGVADDQSSERPTLHDCVEIVMLQADALIDDVLDGLSAVAKATGKDALGTRYPVSKAAVNFLTHQASAVKATFAEQLRLGVYNSGSQTATQEPVVRFDDLQLFDSRQIDASIEFALAQQEVLRCVDDALRPLNGLVSSLLGWITVQPQLNPLKPDAFVRALQSSLASHTPDDNARAALIMPAAGLLGVSLRQLYRELADWLRSQGVEAATPLGTPLGGTVSRQGNTAENSVARTLLTLDKLRKLLTGELDNGLDRSGAQDFLHTVPASFIALEDMKLVEPMMKRLAKRASLPIDITAKADASERQIVREPTQGRRLGRQLGAEVVRMMFDNLMQDERMLLKVRNLVQSLQPVLLALSQADPRFFSERQHPARQFLDRVTHRSLAYSSERDEGFFQFEKSISQVIDELIGGEGDAGAFALVLRGLEDGWAAEEVVQRQRNEEAARALVHAEQRNILAQRLAEDFQQRQAGKEIPELVVGFLRGPWAQVAAESQLRCADGSTDADGYLALVDDLIWSVQLKLARRNRTRLVELVPNLLVKLRQGLQLIGYPEERIPAFFDALISIHEKAFEGPRMQALPQFGEKGVPEPLEATDDSDAAPAPDGQDYSGFWEMEGEVQDLEYMATGTESEMNGAPGPWAVVDLKTGAWVELIVDDVWLRAQLTWASPHRTLFMFISRGGLAHSMSRRTMERLRREGSIRFVSDGHVVDNALDAVVQTALQNELGQAHNER